jgi:hypothetical protein
MNKSRSGVQDLLPTDSCRTAPGTRERLCLVALLGGFGGGDFGGGTLVLVVVVMSVTMSLFQREYGIFGIFVNQ